MSSGSYTMEDITKVKDLLLLINQERLSYSQYLPQFYNLRLQRLNETIKLWQQCQGRIDDYHRRKGRELASCTDFVPRFIQSIREYVLTHEWTWTLKIIHALAYEDDNNISKAADTLWKAGFMSLILEKKQRLIDQFVRQLYLLPRLSCVEVLLDYILYLLTHGDLKRAEDLSEDLKFYYKYVTNEKKNDSRNMARILFYAYQGITHYLKWKAGLGEDSVTDDVTDFIKLMLSEGSGDKTSKNIADKALENFANIKNVPGVWDIFIAKMLEIHEYYGEIEPARKLLQDYRNENLSNPNAHRYLHKFEMEHVENAENDNDKLQSLISVVKLDPSNPLAIQLYTDRQSVDREVISVLFDFLDFDHCKDDVIVWELLDKRLSEIPKIANCKSLEENAIVRKCWMKRKDWWPAYQFQFDNSCSKLTAHKISIYNYLKRLES